MTNWTVSYASSTSAAHRVREAELYGIVGREDFPMELILNYKRVYGSRAPRSNTVLKVHGEMS